MSYKKRYIHLFMVLLLFMFPATIQAKIGLISEDDEIRMGTNSANTVIQKQGLTDETALQDRANAVFDRLLPYAARQNLPYKLQVTREKEINAYAYPGGQLFVTEGLMKQISTDDELAFVLGHELGHSDGYHITKGIERSFLVGLFSTVLYQKNKNLARFLGPILQVGISRGYGFDNEHEADRYGFNIASQAGFNIAGGAVFFHTLQDKYGEGSGSVANFINPHPKNSVRISKELTYIKEYSGGRVDILLPHNTDSALATIHIDQKSVLAIQVPHNNWNTSQRAEWIAGNISRLIHEEKKIDHAKFVLRMNTEGHPEIIYDENRVIAAVYDEDAVAANTDAKTLANQWLTALREIFAGEPKNE